MRRGDKRKRIGLWESSQARVCLKRRFTCIKRHAEDTFGESTGRLVISVVNFGRHIEATHPDSSLGTLATRSRCFWRGFAPLQKELSLLSFAMLCSGALLLSLNATQNLFFSPSEPNTLYHRILNNGSILFAGATATIASAPWNYARNIKYATPPGQPAPSIWCCFRDLFREARTADSSLRFLQQRLRIGWGTARVACGMAVGFQLYETTKAYLEKSSQPKIHTSLISDLAS